MGLVECLEYSLEKLGVDRIRSQKIWVARCAELEVDGVVKRRNGADPGTDPLVYGCQVTGQRVVEDSVTA